MDNKPEYIHGGHLIDIAGYPKFKELILDGVELNPECLVAEELYWTESEQRANIHLKPLEQHKKQDHKIKTTISWFFKGLWSSQ